MTAFNIVRFRVKADREQDFVEAHRRADVNWTGFVRGALVKTGERTYCFVGEWEDFDRLAQAREKMIAILDSFRDTLEDLGGGLGVTDPISGPAVVALQPSR